MRTICIVVTFNRKEWLKKNLAALAVQTVLPDCILVVDNHSTDGTEEVVRNAAANNSCKIEYRYLSENTGGAGGFAYAIRAAVEMGAEFVWGMDDDAIPEPAALEELQKAYQELSKSAGNPVCLWSNCRGADKNGRPLNVNELTFVGFFLPAEVIRKVGLPREEFFLYWDDIEYSLRIRKSGFTIWMVPSSVIRHEEKTQDYYPPRYFGPLKFTWTRMSNQRLYYLIRNRWLMASWKDPSTWYIRLFELPLVHFKLIYFQTGQEKIYKKAVSDAKKGITGKAGEDQWRQ